MFITVPSREPPRDMTRQSSHEPSRTTGREAGRDAGRETGRESTYQDYTILGNGIEDEDVESVSMSSSYRLDLPLTHLLNNLLIKYNNVLCDFARCV